jgi:hypothetical protein
MAMPAVVRARVLTSHLDKLSAAYLSAGHQRCALLTP